jgi:hypothetical protein
MLTQFCIKETGTVKLESKTPQDTEAGGPGVIVRRILLPGYVIDSK